VTLISKRQLFIEHYLSDATGNATEAARLAGYASPRSEGHRLLHLPEMQALIGVRVAAVAMVANEVLERLADHARADFSDFLTIGETGTAIIDLKKAEAAGKLHLIRKVGTNRYGNLEVELYDSQAALVQLGRHHKLFVDRVESLETGTVVVEYVNDWRG